METRTKIEFRAVDGSDLRKVAQFIAELVRQGIVFSVITDNISVQITLTGGY